MKKEYLKPALEVVELELATLFAASTTTEGETENAGTGDRPVGDDTPDLAGRRRGSWGDLWN